MVEKTAICNNQQGLSTAPTPEKPKLSAEQQARYILERTGLFIAETLPASDLVEIIDLISEVERLKAVNEELSQQMRSTAPKIPEWQQRVITERFELDEKIAKLDAHIKTPLFQSLSASNQYLLQHQLSTMMTYSRILGQRIALF